MILREWRNREDMYQYFPAINIKKTERLIKKYESLYQNSYKVINQSWIDNIFDNIRKSRVQRFMGLFRKNKNSSFVNEELSKLRVKVAHLENELSDIKTQNQIMRKINIEPKYITIYHTWRDDIHKAKEEGYELAGAIDGGYEIWVKRDKPCKK